MQEGNVHHSKVRENKLLIKFYKRLKPCRHHDFGNFKLTKIAFEKTKKLERILKIDILKI